MGSVHGIEERTQIEASISTDLISDEDAEMEQARREGTISPCRIPGQRTWVGPPIEDPNRLSNATCIYNAIRKPANWDDQANDHLIAILTSEREFGQIVEDLHDAPRCLSTHIARRSMEVDYNQTYPCRVCTVRGNPVPCFGLEELDDILKPQSRYKRRIPRMDFERNADGHYWKAVYRPARGLGNDGDDENDGDNGGTTT